MKKSLEASPFIRETMPSPPKTTEDKKYFWLTTFSCLLIALGFLMETPKEVMVGLWKIVTSPSILLTDYIELASMGSAFVNSGVTTLFSTILAKKLGVKMSGPLTAALYTMCGFSFFGKNLFNSLPIMIGVYVFSRIEKKKFSNYIIINLFGTALAPAVSLLAFGLGLSPFVGIFSGVIVGIMIGFVLPSLSTHFLSFHQGFSLYNIGFTAGIVGMIVTAVLRIMNFEIPTISHLSEGNNLFLGFFLYFLFFILFYIGYEANQRSFVGYRDILKSSGKLISDFIALDGYGITLINMAIMGIFSTTFVLLVGGQLSGPVIGGIFTVVGFSAYGVHLRNSVPIFLGVSLVALLTGTKLGSTSVLLTALFGTTLAPVAGYYGVVPGIIAGALHMTLVSNVSFLHGGINLYNNGFSGGFTAAFLVPILDSFVRLNLLRLPSKKKLDW